MRMSYEPEESEEFESAKDLLSRRCRQWASVQGLQADGYTIDAALDFRHKSVDGRLNYWTPDHVRRFLTDWVPWSASSSPDELASVPETLRLFLRFLSEQGLRDPTGGTPEANEAAIHAAADEFTAAIADPSKYGPAKRIVLTAMERGIPLDDQQALQEMYAEHLSQDADDYLQIMRHQAEQERAHTQLPVSLPSTDELVAAATESVVVQRLQKLTDWVGEKGRALTPNGALKLADARELSALLDLPDPPAKIRSSTDLYELTLLFEWAKQARLVRVAKGKLLRVQKAAPLLKDPLALWERAFETVFELRDAICRPPWQDAPYSMLWSQFDTAMADALNSLYGLDDPAPIVRLALPTWLGLVATIGFDPDDDDRPEDAMMHSIWRREVDNDLNRMLDALADLGAIEITHGLPGAIWFADLDGDVEMPMLSPQQRAELRAAQSEPGSLQKMTPLGLWATHQRLRAEGRAVYRVGELSAAPAIELLGVLYDHYTPETAELEVANWLRENNETFEALLDAIRNHSFRSRAMALLHLVAELPSAEPELLQRLRADPLLGPYAVNLLISDGKLQHDDVGDFEGLRAMLEPMLQLLELAGPDELKNVLLQHKELPELAPMLAELFGSATTDSVTVAEFEAVVNEVLRGPAREGRGRLRPVGKRTSRPGRPKKRRKKR